MMNERIKELAVQADEFANNWFPPNTYNSNWQEIRDQKFAELVRADERRECERLLGDKRDSLERQWQNGEIGVEYCFQWRTVDELMEAIRARGEVK